MFSMHTQYRVRYREFKFTHFKLKAEAINKVMSLNNKFSQQVVI